MRGADTPLRVQDQGQFVDLSRAVCFVVVPLSHFATNILPMTGAASSSEIKSTEPDDLNLEQLLAWFP